MLCVSLEQGGRDLLQTSVRSLLAAAEMSGVMRSVALVFVCSYFILFSQTFTALRYLVVLLTNFKSCIKLAKVMRIRKIT